jgi:hypothetical protein
MTAIFFALGIGYRYSTPKSSATHAGKREPTMSKEPTWIKCGADFISPDVLRWTEAVWLEPKRKTKKRKATKAGERRVTAAVLTLDSRGYVRLSVIKDEIIENKFGMPLKALKMHVR